ncbi:SDR family NAD(P)-dependent oxidoreductase [archaeon]|nr:MAG: SDR family NAD(P)-dependent oxidoreductase [archaeon]
MTRAAKGVVITGASGGLGRAVALAYATNFPDEDIHYILSGRRVDELKVTEDLIIQRKTESQQITCKHVFADLSDVSDLANVAKQLFDFGAVQLNSVVFINNAGSLGPVRPIGDDMHTADEYIKAFNLNVTSSCFLTSEFVRQ